MASTLFSTTPTDIKGLRIFVPYEQSLEPCQDLQPGSDEFDCTAAVIGLALDILGSKSSRAALKHITRKIRLKDSPELDENTKFDNEITEYLQLIRQNFPHVVVTDLNGMADKNGRTTKFNCSDDFEPKKVAIIEINKRLIDRLVEACRELRRSGSVTNKERFRSLHMRLSVTMAHELVHVYIHFLLRDQLQHTPEGVTVPGYGNKNAGESGRVWEDYIFGGFIDMRMSGPVTGPGLETVAIRDMALGKAWILTASAIDKIIERASDFPSPDSTLTVLDEEYVKTIMDPNWKVRYHQIFPDSSPASKTQRLSDEEDAWLTGSSASQSRKYDLEGRHLRAFTLDPNIGLPFSLAQVLVLTSLNGRLQHSYSPIQYCVNTYGGDSSDPKRPKA